MQVGFWGDRWGGEVLFEGKPQLSCDDATLLFSVWQFVTLLGTSTPLYCPVVLPPLFYPLQVPRSPPPASSGDKYVALVSGLGLGRPEADMLKARMGGGRG